MNLSAWGYLKCYLFKKKNMNNVDVENLDKFILALKDIVIEYEGWSSKSIANEINNQMDNWYMSDRESTKETQSGVRDNIRKMRDILKLLPF
jgi:hypothetical protein